MAFDFDYWPRLKYLWELMQQNPNSRTRDLQREALKAYPLQSVAAQRAFLRHKTAERACAVFCPLFKEPDQCCIF